MLAPELLKKIELISIKGRRLANDLFAGEYSSAFKGRGMEFEEVREYIPGDDVRVIDWNVSARMGHPYVKVFREEREQTLMFLIDTSASGSFGSQARIKRDVVCEIAALLAYAAIRNNDKVGLMIFSDAVERFIPPKKGRAHVWHVIQEILSWTPRGRGTNFKEALDTFNRVMKKSCITFVISDYLGDVFEHPLSLAALRHDLCAMMVLDPLELAFPSGGLVTLSDAETGRQSLVDLSHAKTRAFFAAEREKKIEAERQVFARHAIDFIKILTTDNYIDVLLAYFRLREKRL